MHLWQGGGTCGLFGTPLPAMEIHADEVTIKNFGVKGAKVGIVVVDKEDGTHRAGIKIENVEIRACYQTIVLPKASNGLLLKESILITE